jgi:hypothetical protein
MDDATENPAVTREVGQATTSDLFVVEQANFELFAAESGLRQSSDCWRHSAMAKT